MLEFFITLRDEAQRLSVSQFIHNEIENDLPPDDRPDFRAVESTFESDGFDGEIEDSEKFTDELGGDAYGRKFNEFQNIIENHKSSVVRNRCNKFNIKLLRNAATMSVLQQTSEYIFDGKRVPLEEFEYRNPLGADVVAAAAPLEHAAAVAEAMAPLSLPNVVYFGSTHSHIGSFLQSPSEGSTHRTP